MLLSVSGIGSLEMWNFGGVFFFFGNGRVTNDTT